MSSKAILVDTSVWINFIKGIESDEVTKLATYIEQDDPIYLCPTIIQEVLQGINNDKQYGQVKEYLMAFNILNDDGIEMAVGSAELYRSLRKKGVKIRKSNDCLIARFAIKHGLEVLHQDRDFDRIFENI
ncbi:MAG: PIN domain-containing protein [Cyclobacteriaceae bacterium]